MTANVHNGKVIQVFRSFKKGTHTVRAIDEEDYLLHFYSDKYISEITDTEVIANLNEDFINESNFF